MHDSSTCMFNMNIVKLKDFKAINNLFFHTSTSFLLLYASAGNLSNAGQSGHMAFKIARRKRKKWRRARVDWKYMEQKRLWDRRRRTRAEASCWLSRLPGKRRDYQRVGDSGAPGSKVLSLLSSSILYGSKGQDSKERRIHQQGLHSLQLMLATALYSWLKVNLTKTFAR